MGAPEGKESIADFGNLDEVSETFISKVLTAPGQPYKTTATKQREQAGTTFYTMEYEVQAKNYSGGLHDGGDREQQALHAHDGGQHAALQEDGGPPTDRGELFPVHLLGGAAAAAGAAAAGPWLRTPNF